MQSNKKEDVGQELVKFQRLFYKELQRYCCDGAPQKI